MAQSYINLTTLIPSYYFTTIRTQLTTDFTTLSITNDWTNNGSGKFTYTGKNRVFYTYIRAKQSSSNVVFWCSLYLYRNNTTILDFNRRLFSGSGANDAAIMVGPIVINTDDFFYVYVLNDTGSSSGTSINFQIDLIITAY